MLERSKQEFERARGSLPGGVNSAARAFGKVLAEAIGCIKAVGMEHDQNAEFLGFLPQGLELWEIEVPSGHTGTDRNAGEPVNAGDPLHFGHGRPGILQR